jgi:hypothetical protein
LDAAAASPPRGDSSGALSSIAACA